MIKRIASAALTASIVAITVTMASAAPGKTSERQVPGVMAVAGMGSLPDATTVKMLFSSSVLGSLYLISRRRK